MTDMQPYDVMVSYPGIELRRYPAHMVAETSVHGTFEGAGNTAFRKLAGYIGGQNSTQTSVSMTAPVIQQPREVATRSRKLAMTAPVIQTPDEGGFTISFVLPAEFTSATAPAPTNPEVRVREVAESLCAAITYRGRWTKASYDKHLAILVEAMSRAGLVAAGAPRFNRYNPPVTPFFLRRNEIVVDVEAEPHRS